MINSWIRSKFASSEWSNLQNFKIHFLDYAFSVSAFSPFCVSAFPPHMVARPHYTHSALAYTIKSVKCAVSIPFEDTSYEYARSHKCIPEFTHAHTPSQQPQPPRRPVNRSSLQSCTHIRQDESCDRPQDVVRPEVHGFAYRRRDRRWDICVIRGPQHLFVELPVHVKPVLWLDQGCPTRATPCAVGLSNTAIMPDPSLTRISLHFRKFSLRMKRTTRSPA